MLRLRIAWAWLLVVASPVVAAVVPDSDAETERASANRTREEIFLEVFKRPPPYIPMDSHVTVVIDGGTQQKVRVVFSPDGREVRLEGRTVTGLLTASLRAEVVQQLERAIDNQGWIERAALEAAGLKTAFELRNFEFAIETPPETRGKRVRYLDAPLPDPFTVDAIRPAPVSAFLNLNVKAATRSEATANLTNRQSTVAFATDGAINVRGVVLEGSAFGKTGDRQLVQRGDLRLVYDRPRQALRFTAGDLSYPVVGYQTIVNLGGIGISRDFSLQPHVRTYRTGQFDFYLDRPAEVKVWVNESLVRTLQLPAGAHDIRGLTPAIGQNDLRLAIEDGAGRKELLHFAFIFNPVLLDKGRTLFSANAGFLRTSQDGGYRYDLDKPVVSASYLEGLTDETTLGGYVQATPSKGLFGLRALHVIALGTLQLDAAVSRSGESKWDGGARLELTHSPASRGGSWVQSQAYVEFLGRHFGSIGAAVSAPDDGVNFGASLAVPLGRSVTGQLSGSYGAARSAQTVDSYGATATLTRRWGGFTTGSLSLRHRRTNRGARETQVLVGLSVTFAKGASTFYAAKELESDTVAARWDSGRPSNASTPYGFASTRVGAGGQEHIAGAGYWSSPALAEVSHTRVVTDEANQRSRRNETALRLQSALVFAGNRFAVARTVTENFAIVTGKDGLARAGMKLDPDGTGGSRARSSWLGPAVLGDLSHYRLRDVRIEPVNAPLGATPDRLTYALAPTYKSGFLLRLGCEPRIVAIGRLVDERGEALAHLPIEIHRLDAREEKPALTFTSRGGVFQLPDSRPGRYEIRPSDDARERTAIVEVKEAHDGVFRIGEIVLLAGNQKL